MDVIKNLTDSIKLLKQGFDTLVEGLKYNRAAIKFLNYKIERLERRLDAQEEYKAEQNEND